ncbi:MAG: arsenate reductase [Chloroflexi bacterium]|nr:arsenate reductase [Chloroflexota bacterium]
MAGPGAVPTIQVFGRKDSRETQRALRFFRERRAAISFVDVAVRPPSRGELRRFAQRFGAEALLDRGSRVYLDTGMGYLRMDADEIMDRLDRDSRLLRLPLTRFGDRLAVGLDEPSWTEWLKAAQ